MDVNTRLFRISFPLIFGMILVLPLANCGGGGGGGGSGILLSSLTFADANLAACVNEGWETYVSEKEFLDCGNRGITDIAGIENLTKLTMLLLDNNNISDISALASLTNLTSLHLEDNNLSKLPRKSTWPGRAAAAVFCCVTMATLRVHVVALVRDRGLPANRAGGAFGKEPTRIPPVGPL